MSITIIAVQPPFKMDTVSSGELPQIKNFSGGSIMTSSKMEMLRHIRDPVPSGRVPDGNKKSITPMMSLMAVHRYEIHIKSCTDLVYSL